MASRRAGARILRCSREFPESTIERRTMTLSNEFSGELRHALRKRYIRCRPTGRWTRHLHGGQLLNYKRAGQVDGNRQQRCEGRMERRQSGDVSRKRGS